MKKYVFVLLAMCLCLNSDAQSKGKTKVRKDTTTVTMVAVPGTTGYTVTYVGGDPTKNAENMKTAVKIIGKGVSNTLNVLGGCSNSNTYANPTTPNTTTTSGKTTKKNNKRKK